MKITEEDIVLLNIFDESQKDEPDMGEVIKKNYDFLKGRNFTDVEISNVYTNLINKNYIYVSMIGHRIPEADTLYITFTGEKRVEQIFRSVK